MASSPRLVVRHGPNPNQEFPLVLSSNIVGREPINDVVFPDPEVSRRHARIVTQNNNFYIEDLGSTNGTFVNGRRISSVTRLGNGDIIDLGESIRLTFILEDEPEEPISPSLAAAADPSTSAAINRSVDVLSSAPAVASSPPAERKAVDNLLSNQYLLYGCGGLLLIALICGGALLAMNRLGILPSFLP